MGVKIGNLSHFFWLISYFILKAVSKAKISSKVFFSSFRAFFKVLQNLLNTLSCVKFFVEHFQQMHMAKLAFFAG